MHIAIQRDIGAHLHAVPAASAGLEGTTSAVVNGIVFDRLTGANDLFLSCKVVLQVQGAVTTTAGTVLWNLQHSLTTVSTAFVDFDDKDGTTGRSITITSAGNNEISSGDFDLSSARQFIRVQIDVKKETTIAADTLVVAGAIVLGGGDENPAN